MPYITRSDLEKRYGVDEVEQRLSMLAPDALDTIMADATSMIDGYLGSRYSLPVATVPEALIANACAIARYKLLGDALTDHARDDYRDAVAWLRDVAAGRVILPGAAAVPGNAPGTVVMAAPSERVFGRSGRP